MLLALIAVVGMSVPYVVWFTTSPVDNFKFFTIASIALGLLAVAPVDSAAQRLSAGAGRVLVALLMLASVGTPLLHVVARLMTAPDYLLALQAEARRTELRPSRAWSEENAIAQRLAASMGRDDLLLVLPPSRRETPILLALSGRFAGVRQASRR